MVHVPISILVIISITLTKPGQPRAGATKYVKLVFHQKLRKFGKKRFIIAVLVVNLLKFWITLETKKGLISKYL